MRLLGAISRGIELLGNAGAALTAVCLCLVVLLTVVEIVARSVFVQSVTELFTVGRIVMLLTGFLGAAYAMRMDRHVSITFVLDRLPPRLALQVRTASLIVSLITIVVVTIITYQFAAFSRQVNAQMYSEWKLPVWPFQMVIPVGLAALGLQLLARVIHDVRVVLGGKEAEAEAALHRGSHRGSHRGQAAPPAAAGQDEPAIPQLSGGG